MKIRVLLFGILKDIIEENSVELDIANDTSVDVLKTHLLSVYKKLSDFANFSVAVNEEYVDGNYILKANDVVALIPPVSGG